MPKSKRIGDILVERGVIDHTTAELIEAERLLTRSRFLSAAVAHGRISEIDALAALSTRDGIPAIDLSRAIISTSIVKRVPIAMAQQHILLPVRIDGPYLLVAMATPKDKKVIDELAFAAGMQVLPHAALYSRLIELIPKVYAAAGSYFRAPLAPAELNNQEYAPVITGDEIADELDVEVVIDSDIESIEEDSETSANVTAATTKVKSNTKVILVVEDEPDIAKLINSTLNPLGCEIINASRGLEALQLIKARQPALIILDAMLPEVHGFEICRKVKESKRFANIPVLMISAVYRGWQIADDIKATYKADAFMEKPFRVADLRHIVTQLLERTHINDSDEQLSDTAQRLLQKGQEFLALDDYAQAVDQLQEAESLEPFSAAIQFLLAVALEKYDRAFQAIYHYERAIELKPDYFSAAQKAAQLYHARGFRQKAVEMWQRAMSSAPNPEVREKIKLHLVSLL
ncbi:MAG: response regulator [Deltaproteobacteria bacterium]|nr:response regulator [Deltaproteobacteria bacterium]